MPECLVQPRYSSQTWMVDAITSWIETAKANGLVALVRKFGASVHSIWYSFGEYDLIAVVEVPESTDFAALTIAVRVGMGGGSFDKVSNTPLFNEMDIAASRARAAEVLTSSGPALDLPIQSGGGITTFTIQGREDRQSPVLRLEDEITELSLVPDPEPALVSGRPSIYGIHYPNVNGWYVGKNETELAG